MFLLDEPCVCLHLEPRKSDPDILAPPVLENLELGWLPSNRKLSPKPPITTFIYP